MIIYNASNSKKGGKVIKFEILGTPIGKARPRLGKHGNTYTPSKTSNYETMVKYIFRSKFPDHKLFLGKVEANITAIFEVPKSYSKKKTRELLNGFNNYVNKPDLDNIAKIILDSLNGIAYKDDSQITVLHINKMYGEKAKVIVEIKEMKNEQ